MLSRIIHVTTIICLFVFVGPAASFGNPNLVICGGGKLPPQVIERFMELAEGSKAELVVIPTASSDASLKDASQIIALWKKRGAAKVTVLHTRDRKKAQDAAFVEPLTSATGVWISGGSQSRLADAYQDTAVEKELRRLLNRGGVIGGTSAGAAILSKVMIRRGGRTPVIGQGLDLLPGVIVDQHFLRRDRITRLLKAVERHPQQVGVGVDEETALVVRGDEAQVLGQSYVLVVSLPESSKPPKIRSFAGGEKFNLHKIIREVSIVETGRQFSQLAGFDDLMRKFVRENKIPGASLAMAKDGRLVYARGFGYSDVDRLEPVQPHSLFRIASISKPITAAAIFRLVDQGRAKLDDKVLGFLTHKPHLPDGGEIDPRWKSITLRHLLQHTGGWDRDVSIDPMFHSTAIAQNLQVNPPAGPDEVIRFMLGWKLDYRPGARYAYSNFGYCLLGRVIEKITDQSYEEHVRHTLLGPLGIHEMRIGKTVLPKRAPHEVRYYTPKEQTALAEVGQRLAAKVPRPYGAWHLEAMDSHGGWIASARDVVRFGCAVQHNGRFKLLSPPSRRAMFARPTGAAGHEEDGQLKKRYYSCGWFAAEVKPGLTNYWHTGHLSGTSTILVLRHDGLCWAALFNTNQTAGGASPSRTIDPLIHQAADAVANWPEHDLFQQTVRGP